MAVCVIKPKPPIPFQNNNLSNHLFHGPQKIRSREVIPVSKRYYRSIIFMKLFMIYLILVPYISVIKPSLGCAQDEQAPVFGSGTNQTSNSVRINDPNGSFPTSYRFDLPIDCRDEISPGLGTQTESVREYPGEKPENKPDDTTDDVNKKSTNIWHLDYFFSFLIGFLLGNGR